MGRVRQADGEEWAKIAGSPALRVLSPSESKAVRARLAAAGKENRILKSRIVRRTVRRLKPGEQPGEAPTKRSRWCVCVGTLTLTNAMRLDSYSPTVSTPNIAASLRMAGMVGEKFKLTSHTTSPGETFWTM